MARDMDGPAGAPDHASFRTGLARPPKPHLRSRGDHPLTDLGNAGRLIELLGWTLRYDHDRATWLVWDGVAWRLDEERLIEQFAAEVARGIELEASEEKDPDKRTRLLRFAAGSQSYPRIKAMIAVAEPQPDVASRTADFDADELAINTPSGLVTLSTEGPAKRPQTPYDLHTRITGASYDTMATCPAWEAFVSQAMLGRPQLISYLQRAVGYSALGSRREEVVFFCYGIGGNGKSTFLGMIERALGDYAATVNANALLARTVSAGSLDPDIANLPAVRFLIASEMPENGKLDAAKIKALSGGDTITVRALYKQPFSFRPTFQIWIGVNHRPRTDDLTQGFWRRVHLIPWELNLSPDQQDHSLKSRLLSELPGILRWIVNGAVAYLREGLNPPPEVLAATDSYRAINDPLVAFFSDCCRRDDAAATVEAGKLYAAYTAWCDATGERPRSQRSLGVILTERGIQRVLDPQTRRTIYVGVGLLGAEGTAANRGAVEAQPPADGLPDSLDDLADLFG